MRNKQTEIFSIDKSCKIIAKECAQIFGTKEDVNKLHVSIRLIVEQTLKITIHKNHPTIDVNNKNFSFLIGLLVDTPEFNKEYIPYLYKSKNLGNLDAHDDIEPHVVNLKHDVLRMELYDYLEWFFKSFLKQNAPEILNVWHNKTMLAKETQPSSISNDLPDGDRLEKLSAMIDSHKATIKQLQTEQLEIEMKELDRLEKEGDELQIKKTQLQEQLKRIYEKDFLKNQIEELEKYRLLLTTNKPDNSIMSYEIELTVLDEVIKNKKKEKEQYIKEEVYKAIAPSQSLKFDTEIEDNSRDVQYKDTARISLTSNNTNLKLYKKKLKFSLLLIIGVSFFLSFLLANLFARNGLTFSTILVKVVPYWARPFVLSLYYPLLSLGIVLSVKAIFKINIKSVTNPYIDFKYDNWLVFFVAALSVFLFFIVLYGNIIMAFQILKIDSSFFERVLLIVTAALSFVFSYNYMLFVRSILELIFPLVEGYKKTDK